MFAPFAESIQHRSPAGDDRLGLQIVEEAKKGKLDTVLRELNKFREGAWDQRAFYCGLAGSHLTKQGQIFVSAPQVAPRRGGLLHCVTRLFEAPSPPARTPQHVLILEKDLVFPKSAVGFLVKGDYNIHRAWQARGSGTADTVSEHGADTFHGRLVTAQQALLRAAEMDPADPTPYALLQTVAKGLPTVTKEVATTWLDEARKRDPRNREAHRGHLSLLCKKWCGSHEEMYSFARRTLDECHPGCPLKTLLFQAFCEHHLYLTAFEQDPRVKEKVLRMRSARLLAQYEQRMAKSKKDLEELLRDSREETLSIYKEVIENRPIENVAHYGPHYDAFMWFCVQKDEKMARKVFDKMSPYFPI